MRRDYLLLLLLLGFGCIACHTDASEGAEPVTADHPNVLFLAVDDLNNLLGPLETFTEVKTPNIDRLAARGVLFGNAHCQAPLCGPSRASIMTGLRPSTTGIYGMTPDDKVRSENPLTRDITLLPAYFKQQGYHTMGIGKLFHIHAPEGVFDESGGRVKGFGPLPPERFVWDGHGTADRSRYGKTSTDWGAFPEQDSLMPDHQSVNWAAERLARTYDQPFFLGVGLLRVHVPLYVPQKWFDLHPLDSIKTPPYRSDDLNDVPPVALQINDLPMMPTTTWAIESEEWPRIIQAYLACISFVDYEIGRLLDALEASPHAENTVIVMWSDHGYRLGEKETFAKHALWDKGTRSPLLFAGPGVPQGAIINEPAELLSIYPTLLDLCGLPAYPRNEGKSLVPLMKGEDAGPHYAISTFGKDNHAVQAKGCRYIRYEDGAEEFYDHTRDPDEFDNVANEPQYAAVMGKLRKELPTHNAYWDTHSMYKFQPYFVAQKARTDEMAKTQDARLTNFNLTEMQQVRKAIHNGSPIYLAAYKTLLSAADKALKAPLYSVMQKTVMPPSGDKHDYLTLAPYWWPDPEQPDGLPWIRKDGKVNPTTKDESTDDLAKDRAFANIETLALAAWLSGETTYAQRAVAQINTWFLDEATRMNPNFNYAQGIPGRNDGRCFGIIEFAGIQRVITALELLEVSGDLPAATKAGMQQWLTTMLDWLQHSELGVEESKRENNHATWHAVQVVCLLRHLERNDEARQILATIGPKFIRDQIEPDGRQPHELQRTKALSYSVLNLRGLTRLAYHAEELGLDLWNHQTGDGRSLSAAYDFLRPFAFTEAPWPYQQLGDQEAARKRLRQLFHQSASWLKVPENCLAEQYRQEVNDIRDLLFVCPG